jgi:predicted Zn finger-like uncharacterized protein
MGAMSKWPIEIDCPHCGATFLIVESDLDDEVSCGECGHEYILGFDEDGELALTDAPACAECERSVVH